jgi:fructoselysine-6-P-deglycase FrlB-like protein
MKIQNEVSDVLDKVLESKKKMGGIQNVVWVAAGGSFGGFYPAQYFMSRESKNIPSQMFTSNEFNYATPNYVNENTLAVICSMRGTKETCVAAQTAKKLGATTIGLYVEESLLTDTCDFNIQYESIALDESHTERVNSSIGLAIAINLVEKTQGYSDYKLAMDAFDIVHAIYLKAVDYTTPLAKKWAEQNKNEKTIYVMGSGPAYGSAYIFSICNIEEMLQIDSPTVNSCEFFHGPFEVIDKSTSVFQLVSVGRMREADERAVKFLKQYGGDKVYLLDGKELGLNDLDDKISEYFNHVLFSPILNNVYMRQLSYATSKDFNTRRYMWKVAY